MQNTFSQSGNDSKWFSKKSYFRIGMWHSRPPRDPPPPSWQIPTLISILIIGTLPLIQSINQLRLTWILPGRIDSNITSLLMPAHPHEGSLPIQKPDNICLEARCYPLISNPFAERTCVWGKSDRDILWFLILINNPLQMKEEGSLFHSGLQFGNHSNTQIRK